MIFSRIVLFVVLLSSSLIIYANSVPWELHRPNISYVYDRIDQPDYFKKGLSNPEITAEECLTYVLYGEARGEGDVGILAVAFVVYNRHKKEGISYCDVIRKPHEFEFHISKLHSRSERDTWMHLLDISYFLISDNGYDRLTSPVAGALYFNSLAAAEQSIMGKNRFIKKIGHHYFYK